MMSEHASCLEPFQLRYDRACDTWEPQCPHGDICSGCDAAGYCERGRDTTEKEGTMTTEQPFAAHVRATALAVLGKESDAWTPVEWSKAAITLASAVVAVAGDINKFGTCAVCGGRGEVEATPGQPGDGPMPCQNCQPEQTS